MSSKKSWVVGLAAALLASTPAVAQQAAAAPTVSYIHAGRLLADPATGRVTQNQTLVIENGRVREIVNGFVGQGDVVDLSDKFVLPGLIDSHVHITNQQGEGNRVARFTNTAADSAVQGAAYALVTLRAGFTTVADLGGGDADVQQADRGALGGQRQAETGHGVQRRAGVEMIATHAVRARRQVMRLAADAPRTPTAQAACAAFVAAGGEVTVFETDGLPQADLVVDALYGIGLSRAADILLQEFPS